MKTLAKQIKILHTMQILPETAVKEQAARYQALLEKLPRRKRRSYQTVPFQG